MAFFNLKEWLISLGNILNGMKKLVYMTLVIVILGMSVSSPAKAVWYNPLSWFDGDTEAKANTPTHRQHEVDMKSMGNDGEKYSFYSRVLTPIPPPIEDAKWHNSLSWWGLGEEEVPPDLPPKVEDYYINGIKHSEKEYKEIYKRVVGREGYEEQYGKEDYEKWFPEKPLPKNAGANAKPGGVVSAAPDAQLQEALKEADLTQTNVPASDTKTVPSKNKQSIGKAIANIATSIPSIERLIFACAWIIGLCLVIKSLFDMVRAGSGQNQQVGWGGIMLTFSIGILLIALADTIGILLGTIGITSETIVGGNPELQQIGKGSQEFSDYALAMVKGAFAILKPFGFFAVIKGLLILKDVPQNRNNATAGKGATFIIGGVLLANVEWAACTIEGTFSSSSSICG